MAADSRAILAQASEWLGRALAVVLVMIVPGFLGGWLDEWLGTTLLMPLGFGLGMVAGTTALVIIARAVGSKPPDGIASNEVSTHKEGVGSGDGDAEQSSER